MSSELRLVERVNDWVCSIISAFPLVASTDYPVIKGCNFGRRPMVFT